MTRDTVDRETLDCYAARAADYAERISRGEPDADLQAFIGALPMGSAPVLDWGCGPGNSSAILETHGIAVEATDASPEMAELAVSLGVHASVEPFEALDAVEHFRGIWANFSLLHAPRDAMPDLLNRAACALIPGGILHIGMKAGQGSARDAIGRFFTYWDEAPLTERTEAAGFTVISVRHGEGPGLDGRIEPFVIHLSRKPA